MELRGVGPATDEELARDLLQLQHEAYAVEAALIGDDRIPPLGEGLAELRAAPLAWIGAWSDTRLVGAVAWTESPRLLDLDRLVVSPGAARQGIGTALVRRTLQLAGERPTVVSTGRGNRPARALYERLGFVTTGDTEVLPGLWVTGYRYWPVRAEIG
ncbi:GNAT family N-acetyltransferase [Modestobacter sp. SYSU DS0290]